MDANQAALISEPGQFRAFLNMATEQFMENCASKQAASAKFRRNG
jgi:hypothetical protein